MRSKDTGPSVWTIPQGEMKQRVLPQRSPNKRMQPTAPRARRG
jgi:hypothetical protein